MSDIIVGIDLGTTYSLVAVYRNNQIEIIPNEQGNFTLPSWVSFTETEISVGQPAKDKAVVNPGNTIFGVKRYIGRDYDDQLLQENLLSYPYDIIDLNNKPLIRVDYKNEVSHQYLPEEISGMILEKLKVIAEKHLGCPITKAVITVPAHFNDSQRQVTKNAGAIAGLEVMRIINEPTAASLAYGIHKKNEEMEKPCTLLIYDFGGGTFDVSIITIDNGVFEVKTTNGEAYLGGDDIDLNLTNHFIEEFKRQNKIDLNYNKNAVRRIRHQCEKLKRELTSNKIGTIEVDYIYLNGDNTYDLVSSLTREKFDTLNAELFNKTIKCVQQTLADAKMKKEDIDEVILIGGSSRIPKVRSMLADFFSKDLNISLNPDEAVARGAAIQAAILSGETDNLTNLLLYDVCPHSLGVIVNGSLMSTIIPRNTQIPTSRKKRYDITAQGSQISIVVFEGDNERVEQITKLREFQIMIPKSYNGKLKFDIIFDINVEGILKVTAKMIDGDIMQNLQISPKKFGLPNYHLQKCIENAKQLDVEDEAEENISIAKDNTEDQS